MDEKTRVEQGIIWVGWVGEQADADPPRPCTQSWTLARSDPTGTGSAREARQTTAPAPASAWLRLAAPLLPALAVGGMGGHGRLSSQRGQADGLPRSCLRCGAVRCGPDMPYARSRFQARGHRTICSTVLAHLRSTKPVVGGVSTGSRYSRPFQPDYISFLRPRPIIYL
jgi:hypothetical protein